MITKIVKIGMVDVDKTYSPFGFVEVYEKGKSKQGKWKHYFRSHREWTEFYDLWRILEEPFYLKITTSKVGSHTWSKP